MARSQLRHRALARLPLTEAEVERLYAAGGDNVGMLHGRVATLCESHERLRAELQGAEILMEDDRRELASLRAERDELRELLGTVANVVDVANPVVFREYVRERMAEVAKKYGVKP